MCPTETPALGATSPGIRRSISSSTATAAGLGVSVTGLDPDLCGESAARVMQNNTICGLEGSENAVSGTPDTRVSTLVAEILL